MIPRETFLCTSFLPTGVITVLMVFPQECRGVFERMVASDGEAGKRERTGWLALLELEKRVRAYDLGESKESVVGPFRPAVCAAFHR